MSRGRPAFGIADRRASPSVAARRSIDSSIGAGPTLQLTPTMLGAALEQDRRKLFGRRAVEAVAVLLGRHLRDDRQIADPAHRLHRRADLVEVAERLEDEQVDAAVRERRRLLEEILLRLVDAGLAPGLDANAERTDGAGHVGVCTHSSPDGGPPPAARAARRPG